MIFNTMKRRHLIVCILLFVPLMVSCHKESPVGYPESSQAKSIEDNSEVLQEIYEKENMEEKKTDNDLELPANNSKLWHEITGEELEEDIFLENLDIDLLEIIAEQFQSLVGEIDAHQYEDPESVLRGDWITDYRDSIQYNYIVDLGIEAVKPMYYILYKSEQAGLYEYIICSAINDITKYDFSYSDNYRWSNAYEFRQLYNEKVEITIEQLYRLLNDNSMDSETQTDAIIELGIFCIPLLLNELDSENSSLSPQQMIYCIKTIYHQFSGSQIDDLDSWRDIYEEDYRNMIEIL